MLILAGDPAKDGSGAMYGEGSEAWFSSPDNVAIDPEGRLWISTDQGGAQAKNNIPDGMYCCDLEGAEPRRGQVLLRGTKRRRDVRPGVHPGRPDPVRGRRSTRQRRTATSRPSRTRRPAGRTSRTGMPPRPSIVAITKVDGGPIGS